MPSSVQKRDLALDQQDFILAMTDFAIETYHPNETPCVLMWREFMNRYNAEKNPGTVHWRNDNQQVFDHWRLYGTRVAAMLGEIYRVTVVKVSSKIREFVNHGDEPRLGGKRTAEWYRRCLPRPRRKTMGIACFPPSASMDHPLVVAKLKNRAQSAANGFSNAIGATDAATGHGVLSDPENERIKEQVKPIVLDALEDKHPLFLPRPNASQAASEQELMDDGKSELDDPDSTH